MQFIYLPLGLFIMQFIVKNGIKMFRKVNILP